MWVLGLTNTQQPANRVPSAKCSWQALGTTERSLALSALSAKAFTAATKAAVITLAVTASAPVVLQPDAASTSLSRKALELGSPSCTLWGSVFGSCKVSSPTMVSAEVRPLLIRHIRADRCDSMAIPCAQCWCQETGVFRARSKHATLHLMLVIGGGELIPEPRGISLPTSHAGHQAKSRNPDSMLRCSFGWPRTTPRHARSSRLRC
jgi:hypothetical protein